MGTQKIRWLKKYSPRKSTSIDVDQLHERAILKRSLRHLQMGFKATDYSIVGEMYRVACEFDFASDKCRKLVDSLLQRLNQSRLTISVGEIKDFNVPIHYVKPINYNGDLSVGNRFGIHLQPWYFEYHTNYKIMLRNETGYPSIFLTREKDGSLAGAANFLFGDNNQVNYPSFLYNPEKVEALFKLECIVPFIPSRHYKKV